MASIADGIDAIVKESIKDKPIIKNQHDKARFQYVCTVVNMLPFSFIEQKPQLLPSQFEIAAADPEDGFSLTYVGEAMYWLPNPLIDEGRPGANIKQIVPPRDVAASIVNDFSSAHLAIDTDSGPGLFFLEGRLSVSDVKKEYGDLLEQYRRRQLSWYRNLVMLADADWHKSKNQLAVSSLQRIAANTIGFEGEWVNAIPTVEEASAKKTMKCPFCRVVIDADSVKCANCREVVDAEAYAKLTKG